MPPPEYAREMVWQAIAHGVDSVGWFVYSAFWWVLPGTEAWDEIGRMGHEVLEPLTPTLYQMRNAPQPVGLLYCYSQEAVDGLKEVVWDKDQPHKGVVRWWAHHATQEAYEVLKYAHIPVNVVSEYRLFADGDLPWKVLVIPYVEHLHAKSRQRLKAYIEKGGTVYVGANSTLDLPGIKKLPVSFDTKFTTWWPKERKQQWNQRRVRAYLIGPFLVKARQVREALSSFCEAATVTVEDPQVVYNVRQAGTATYVFFINDHQINPTSPEMRKRRQQYNHFMLMPMRFPAVRTTATIKATGHLYSLLRTSGPPIEVGPDEPASLDLQLDGGGGRVFLLLPEPIKAVEIIGQPVRGEKGVSIRARVLGDRGPIAASLPLRIDLACDAARQTVYATTSDGVLVWTVPFLNTFPEGPTTITVTDIASGKAATAKTGQNSSTSTRQTEP